MVFDLNFSSMLLYALLLIICGIVIVMKNKMNKIHDILFLWMVKDLEYKYKKRMDFDEWDKLLEEEFENDVGSAE